MLRGKEDSKTHLENYVFRAEWIGTERKRERERERVGEREIEELRHRRDGSTTTSDFLVINTGNQYYPREFTMIKEKTA